MWRALTLAEISVAPIVYGIVQPGQIVPDGTPFIQTRDLGRSFVAAELDRTSREIADKYHRSQLKAGDIVIALRGDVGAVRSVPGDLEGANISRGVARIRPGVAYCSQFVEQALSSPAAREALRLASRGSSLIEIPISELRQIRVPIPPFAEQRKIAEILRTWDDAIDAAERLLKARTAERDAMRKSTVNRIEADSPVASLGSVSEIVRRKPDGQDHPVMTIASKSGFILQTDKYQRDMAGESAKTYTLLSKGEFSYNKGNSLTYPQGCFFMLEETSALVPSVYFSFRLLPELDADFYAQLFASGYLNKPLARLINSGVRNNGLLNISRDDFLALQVPVSPRHVQRRVAKLLSEMQAELALLDRKIELLKRQKRGLMQKLLSGEIRVKTYDAHNDEGVGA